MRDFNESLNDVFDKVSDFINNKDGMYTSGSRKLHNEDGTYSQNKQDIIDGKYYSDENGPEAREKTNDSSGGGSDDNSSQYSTERKETKKVRKTWKWILAGVIVILAIIAISGSVYTVPQKQYVAVRQFGKIVKIETTPGLKFKVPFIQNIQRISAATILYDIAPSDVITKDKKSMIADNYVLWKVDDPTKYIRTLDAVKARAEERIEAAVYNALKNVISSMSQDEIIEARGERLTQLLTEEANSDIAEYGILIIQSEIKSLDLPDDNKEAVYERMISERQNIAASYTAQGEAEAQKIRNETDREVTVMEADAKKQAAIIEGEGEAEYMKTLQDAYNTAEKAEFYNYIRSLDALKASLKGENKTLILDKDSEIAQVLYGTGLSEE